MCMVLIHKIHKFTKDNKAFFDRLGDRVVHMLKRYPNSLFIFGVDFNLVLDSTLDRWSPQTGCPTPNYVIKFMENFFFIHFFY